MVRHGAITAEQGIRLAVSLPVRATIAASTPWKSSIRISPSNHFQAFSSSEMAALRDRCINFAADGGYELFKVTTKYDRKVSREQHHSPSEQELRCSKPISMVGGTNPVVEK